MLKVIRSSNMGHSNLHWLDSFHHFSFSKYYDPDNIQFGVLRVVNDDRVGVGTGFGTHPHKDMEIISYVVDGELTHADSMGNKRSLKRGEVQYMSAGTGITHSEHNLGHELLRFLQVWIFPDKEGYEPNYGDELFSWEERINKWMPIASGDGDSRFPIQIHADVHLYAAYIPREDVLEFSVSSERQAYLVLIEGAVEINGEFLEERDALEIVEEDIIIKGINSSHLFIIEMKKA